MTAIGIKKNKKKKDDLRDTELRKYKIRTLTTDKMERKSKRNGFKVVNPSHLKKSVGHGKGDDKFSFKQ